MGAVSAGAMIAQQVAGKAARDAYYLSQFDVRTLPFVMAASAVLSLATMWWVALLMMRRSPARVVPVAFGVSGALFLAEWGLCFVSPELAAIALYLHTALFGGVIVSAFWSLINETFVPHSGRGAMSWIAGGGALGGVLGGIAVWRAAGHIDVPTLLPILAVVNLVCFWGVLRLGRAPAATAKSDGTDEPALAPLRLLRDTPYLRGIALVVLLGAVLSGILDYVFSAQAVRTHGNGNALLAFFALFWLIVGVASFGLQALLGRLVLDKLGLAVTVALLSGVVVVGGAMALAFPRLWTMTLLRGGEASQRNSLFRAAYELLYTPLAEVKKRAAKLLIDVGFDRVGTMGASAIVALVLLVAPAHAEPVLLIVAIGCALVTITQTRALHRGYVALLEDNLRTVAQELERPPERGSMPPETKGAIRDELVAQLDELRAEDPRAFERATGEPHPSPAEAAMPTPAGQEARPLVQHVGDLTSGDVARARRVLRETTPLPSPLVGFVVPLLADKDLHLDAVRALRQVASRNTGQLVDALCDPSVAFDIRRRIPRALSRCPTPTAADGLFRGFDDDRFEVRYACGRALLRLRSSDEIQIDLERVVMAVGQEGKRVRAVWKGPSDDDEQEDGESTDLFGRLLHDQIDRSLEHIFNILALHFDPATLRTAFNALHAEDEHLRGTALEYLDTVLPPEVRELVWPFLGAQRPMRPARPAKEILEDITRASEARKDS